MPSFLEYLFGQPEKFEQIQRYNPQQLSALQNILSMGLQGLKGMQNVDPYAGFAPIAQQARSQFEQQTVPSLAERFTGTGGALSSPAFASQLGAAGAGLNENLAALQSQYGLSNRAQLAKERGQLMSLLGMGLTPTFETLHRPAQEGLLQSLFGGVGQAALAGLTGGASGLGLSLGLNLLNKAGSSAPSVGQQASYMPRAYSAGGFSNPAVSNELYSRLGGGLF